MFYFAYPVIGAATFVGLALLSGVKPPSGPMDALEFFALIMAATAGAAAGAVGGYYLHGSGTLTLNL